MTPKHYTVFKDTDALFAYLARQIKRYSEQKKVQHISLSGGSTPKGLFSYIVDSEFKTSIAWSNLHFWWGDERCVTFDDTQSNFGEAKRLLFDHVSIPKDNLHPIPVSDKHTVAGYAGATERFTEAMLRYLDNDKGYPVFDWVLLGVGDDGHTASLFPNTSHLHTDDIALTVLKPNTDEYRVSLSTNTLRVAKRISYLVTGEAKARVIADILLNKGAYKCYPAFLIRSTLGKTEYLLDMQASRLLENQ